MSEDEAGLRAQLRRAQANARILAARLARGDHTGRWNGPIQIVPDVNTDQSRREGLSGTQPPDWVRTVRRVAVVGWDLGHNAAARTMTLADLLPVGTEVDVIGPLWTRFGRDLWSPLRGHRVPPISFPAHRLTDFVARAYGVAAHHQGYDLVYVSKPRLPSLILGALLQRANRCPVIVDIDDNELAFVDLDRPLLDLGPDELDELFDPTGAVGTALGVALGTTAPMRTVSNVALQQRYGGTIVRHARDERTFVLNEQNRAEGRQRLGAASSDFVVLFMGTPRPHKGLQLVVDALGLLDERFVLHVVGVANRDALTQVIDGEPVRVATHPPIPFSDVPTWLAGGDAIVLMQDLSSPISRYQIPAKIAEGLSMGMPVITTDAPPLADLPSRTILRADDAGELAELLRRLRDSDDELARTERRALFCSEFSNAVNKARIELVAELSTGLPAEAHDGFTEAVLSRTATAYTHSRNGADHTRPHPGAPGEGVDVVMFWKQNDTGLYGRRSEMLARYFAKDPRIRTVLHLDAPVATSRAVRDARFDGPATDHAPLVSQVLLDRRLGIADHDDVHHRTLLYSDDGAARRDPLSGSPLPNLAGFADYVASEASSLGIEPSAAVAWVCPVVWEFPEVHEALGFGTVACDLVDDQRRFAETADDVTRVDGHYRDVLDLSTHVFTNCRPTADAFAVDGHTIHVVPNGAETDVFDPAHVRRDVDTPVIAYVGNMRDRIDWPLIEAIAQTRPDYRFELVGSFPGTSSGHRVATSSPNVSFRGVVPYADLPAYLQTVDVGIVPHVNDALTARMNPLKIYSFYAAGLPIVATPTANVDELAESVEFATDVDEFAYAVDRGIEKRRSGLVDRRRERLEEIDWRSRAKQILDLLLLD